MKPDSLRLVAEYFAHRGWAAVVFMRRGYGKTTASYTGGYGPCSNPDFLASGTAIAADYEAAIHALSKRPLFNARKVIAVGQSAGGYGVLTLAGRRVPGLQAVVNFSGGRGSIRRSPGCNEDRLAKAFTIMGEKALVPSFWLYAESDSYFRPALVSRLHTAFHKGPVRAELRMLRGISGEGHFLIHRRAKGNWDAPLDAFLAGLPMAGRVAGR